MFISLSSSNGGNACAVKNSINMFCKEQSPEKTQFFDWLVCSMKSINEVLEYKPILFDEPLGYNYVYQNTTIFFKDFDLLISHHDIVNLNDNTINELIDKYTRRRQRFIDTIKNNNNIFFIRYCTCQYDLDVEEIIKFYHNIRNIKNDLNFKFILISEDFDLQIPYRLYSMGNFFSINLKNYVTNSENSENCKNDIKIKELYNEQLNQAYMLENWDEYRRINAEQFNHITQSYKCIYDIFG